MFHKSEKITAIVNNVSLTHSLCHPLLLCLSNACNPHVLLPGIRSDTASPQGINWIKCVMRREFNRRNATAPLSISFVPCCSALSQTPTTPSGREERGCKATWHTQGDSLSWCAIWWAGYTHLHSHTLRHLQGNENECSKKPAERVVESGLHLGLDLMFMDRPWPQDVIRPSYTYRQVTVKLSERKAWDDLWLLMFKGLQKLLHCYCTTWS